MKQIWLALIVCGLSLLTAGCAPLLSASSAGPIEDAPGNRTWGTWLEDEGIETKSYVNLKQADEGFKDSQIGRAHV